MKFKIHAQAPDGSKAFVFYDNMTSELTYEDGSSVVNGTPKEFGEANAVSVSEPGNKGGIRVLKISLGLSCNYECTYCSQRFVPNSAETNPGDVHGFVAQLKESLGSTPTRVEFWGGEPFVYWKTFKPLAEAIRNLYPDAEFLVITNGSLLDTEKNQWLDDLGFNVGISHDAGGYHVRGLDPLDDPEKRAAIMDLYARLKPKGRISINAMLHKGNQSRAEVQKWHRAVFGDDVDIGEGAFIDPYDEGGLESVFTSIGEHMAFRLQAYNDLRTGLVGNFSIASQKIKSFIDSVVQRRPASALGQKCGMDRPDNLAVDLKGNVLTCQNVSAKAVSNNGQSHKIGHLSDLHSVKLNTATHWSKRPDCVSCPVVQLCQGSCMFLEGNLWDAACDSAYSDNIPFFVSGIEALTGLIPFYIEGEFKEERKDLYGFVHGVPASSPKKVIPIKQV